MLLVVAVLGKAAWFAGNQEAHAIQASALDTPAPAMVVPAGMLLGLCAWRGRFGIGLHHGTSMPVAAAAQPTQLAGEHAFPQLASSLSVSDELMSILNIIFQKLLKYHLTCLDV